MVQLFTFLGLGKESWHKQQSITLIQAAMSKHLPNFVTDLEFVNDENKGEIMGFWGKRMLPQIFKWSDDEKSIICGALNEGAILGAASEFICNDLALNIESRPESDVAEVVPLSPWPLHRLQLMVDFAPTLGTDLGG